MDVSETASSQFCFIPFFLEATQPAISIKEEVASRAGSEQGEEEMEVDSADEQEEEAKGQSRQASSQVSKSTNAGETFNTLSSLGSLKPGIIHTHTHTHTHTHKFTHTQISMIYWHNRPNTSMSTLVKIGPTLHIV